LIFSLQKIKSENRICRKIPAVTSVDEWTSADTGVGAAMAAGSQLENGICALLVNLAIRIKDLIIIRNLFSHKWE
jgi:thiazole synthase ThiGH ThiG subunit